MTAFQTLIRPEMYLLDTDICSYLINRRYKALSAKFNAVPRELIAVSAITKAETWFGLEWLQIGFRRRLIADEFYSSVRVLAWPEEAASVYGDIRARLRRTNQNIGLNDVMIAAHAIALDATLVTNNTRHFSRIGPPLKLENWLEPQS